MQSENCSCTAAQRLESTSLQLTDLVSSMLTDVLLLVAFAAAAIVIKRLRSKNVSTSVLHDSSEQCKYEALSIKYGGTVPDSAASKN